MRLTSIEVQEIDPLQSQQYPMFAFFAERKAEM